MYLKLVGIYESAMTAYRSEIKTGFTFFDEVFINPPLQVFDRLVSKGATVIVIEHGLDVIS